MKLEDKVFEEIVKPLIADIRNNLLNQSCLYGNNRNEDEADKLRQHLLSVKKGSEEAVSKLISLENWLVSLMEKEEEE